MNKLGDLMAKSSTGARLRRLWAWLVELGRTLRPCRFSALVLVIGWVVLIFVPQGQDALKRLAEQRRGIDEVRAVSFLLFATLIWALSTWYWARTILLLRRWRTPGGMRVWVPRLLGTLAPLGVAVGFFRAGQTYESYHSERALSGLWLLGGLYLALAGIFFGFVVGRRDLLDLLGRFSAWLGSAVRKGAAPRAAVQLVPAEAQFTRLPKPARRITQVSILLCVLLIAALTVAPVPVGTSVGTLQIIFLAAAAVILLGTILVHFGRVHRAPYVALVVLVAILFSYWNDNHRIRLVENEASEPPARELIAKRFVRWSEGQENDPVFIISAEGGGIRAAYWTASVLAAIQDRTPGFARHVFAISGVSGGSLGGAVFASLVAESVETGALPCDTYTQCTRQMFTHDLLSPAVGMWAGPDFMQRFLPWPFSQLDRSRGIEGAWEAAWSQTVETDRLGRPFLELWSDDDNLEIPSLILNSTHVETGRRVLTSNLIPWRADRQAQFRDAYDMHSILEADLPLSTAVHNSARFTYISPAGSMVRVDGGLAGHVVDGGYFDNSGAAAAQELIEVVRQVACFQYGPSFNVLMRQAPVASDPGKLAACRQRFHHIHIANDPDAISTDIIDIAAPDEDREPEKGLLEAFSPVWAMLRTRSARGSYSVAIARAESEPGNFWELRLCKRIPLGWQLSATAREAMDDDLDPGSSCRATDRKNNYELAREIAGLVGEG